MSNRSRVLWTEGLFLRPHHFQQHDRWLEHLVEARGAPLRNHPWGFVDLKFDKELLALGKLSLRLARGVFADGTPFDIPDTDAPPPPLDLDETVRDQIIYLCFPARRANAPEYDRGDAVGVLARYRHAEIEIRDTNADNNLAAQLEVGKPRLRLLRAAEPRQDYVCLGVVRVIEVRADKTVILDDAYIPPLLDCQANEYLNAFMGELQGMLAQRGQALAARVAGTTRGGVADVADFLMLLLINRTEPVVEHLLAIRGVHPEEFFRLGLATAGEAASFTTKDKRPASLAPYRHDDLQNTFVPLIMELRRSLSTVTEQTAIPIPLEEKRFGIRAGRIADRTLIGTASFVLAVSAAIPQEDLRRRFPSQTKIGPPDRIVEMANLQLPGIVLNPMSVAPRQLPYHAGFVYFELDPNSPFWKTLRTNGGIALHIGDEFPELVLEFWAIRQ